MLTDIPGGIIYFTDLTTDCWIYQLSPDGRRFATRTEFSVRIYDSRGHFLSSPPLPSGELHSFNVISLARSAGGSLRPHTIYDLETGAAVWSRPAASRSAVAGAFIVYAEGPQLIAEQYPE